MALRNELYFISMAARLLGMTARYIRRWFMGFVAGHRTGTLKKKPMPGS